jgi:hypothetical protein
VFVVEGSAAGRRLRVLRAPMSSVCGAGLVPQIPRPEGRKQRMASLVLKMSVSLDGYIAHQPTAAPIGSLRDAPMTPSAGPSRP